VTNWLAKQTSLPVETRTYVLKITGRKVEQWIDPEIVARAKIEPMPARAPCIEVARVVLDQVRIARLAQELTTFQRQSEALAAKPKTEIERSKPSEKVLGVAKLNAAIKGLRAKRGVAEAATKKDILSEKVAIKTAIRLALVTSKSWSWNADDKRRRN
jgi:hypothetical protein